MGGLLETYGTHLSSCKWRFGGDFCTCGLEQAKRDESAVYLSLRQLQGELEAERGYVRDGMDACRNYEAHIRDLEADLTAERAACLEIVKGAGCLCYALLCANDEFPGRFPFQGEWEIRGEERVLTVHDPRCPDALAAQIEARGASGTTGEAQSQPQRSD